MGLDDLLPEGLAPGATIDKDAHRVVKPQATSTLDLGSYEPVYLGLPYIFPSLGITYDLLRTYQMEPSQPSLHPRIYTTPRPLVTGAPPQTHPSWLHTLVLIPKDEWKGFVTYASGCQYVDRQRKTFICLGHGRVSVTRPSWDPRGKTIATPPPPMTLNVIGFADWRGACVLREPTEILGPAKISYLPRADEAIRQMGRAILQEDPVEYVKHVLGPVTVPDGRPLTREEWWGLFQEGDPSA